MAKSMVALARYALILLDLGLPDGDGLTILPTLRQNGQVPIIILTARDQLVDRLSGLDGGADDYIVKPVDMPELIARCRVVLRRPGARHDSVISYGPLALDTVTRAATLNDAPLLLGRRETSVLEQLLRSAGRVSPRTTLEEAIYTFDDDVSPNALEAAVSRLRKALTAEACPLAIVTVRGVGWMLVNEVSRDQS